MSCCLIRCAGRSLSLATVILVLLSTHSNCFGALVNYWTFDDESGTATVDEVGTNTGTLVPGGTGPDWVTSGLAAPLTSRSFMPSTAALSFKPSGPDYVNLGNLGFATTSSTGEASLSMWINPAALTNDMRLFSQLTGGVGQAGAAGLFTGGGIQVWSGSAWQIAMPAGNLTTGSWQHLAFVWTNDSVQAFLDGTPFAPATARFDYAAADFGLGARFLNAYGTGFDGIYDDVSVWNHALSLSEVTTLASGASLLAAPVPEPSSFLLLGMGAVGLMNNRRRKRNQQDAS